MRKSFDVLVAGGGPAGAATALALAGRGLAVVMLERSDYATTRFGETLPPAIQAPLVRLGVWEQFLREHHTPSFGIHSAWGRSALHQEAAIFNPYGAGWHIDRARFDAMLSFCAEGAGATVLRQVRSIRPSGSAAGGWSVQVTHCDRAFSFRAKFLVDATGRGSALAGTFGATRLTCDHLIGAVTFLPAKLCASIPFDSTLIESTERGWWYSAGLPDLQVVVAFMSDADIYARAARGSPQFWRDELLGTEHTQLRVDLSPRAMSPRLVAANTSILSEMAGAKWLAVGDAAAAFDPLSSQGIYKALKSGLRAGQAIEDHFGGDNHALEDYAREVKEGFSNYLSHRRFYYGMETRWPKSPFWHRRQTAQKVAILEEAHLEDRGEELNGAHGMNRSDK